MLVGQLDDMSEHHSLISSRWFAKQRGVHGTLQPWSSNCSSSEENEMLEHSRKILNNIRCAGE